MITYFLQNVFEYIHVRKIIYNQINTPQNITKWTIWNFRQKVWKPGPRPTNDTSIEFEIRPKFEVLLFKLCKTDRNESLHTARQCNYRDVYIFCCDRLSIF